MLSNEYHTVLTIIYTFDYNCVFFFFSRVETECLSSQAACSSEGEGGPHLLYQQGASEANSCDRLQGRGSLNWEKVQIILDGQAIYSDLT